MYDSKNNPAISIVVLTKNGGEFFRNCIENIFGQNADFAYEVVIIDSGSTDSTLAEIKKYPIRLYQIKPEEFKFGVTRDYGFSQARGEYIVTLSQDAIPCDEQWLQHLISPFADPAIAVVQGIEITPDSSDVFYWERKGSFYFTREHDRWLRGHDGIGLSFVNVAIRKDIWQKYKFGDVSMSEDKVFQGKLQENGHLIHRAENAMVYHWHNYTVRTLVKRCENEGLGWRYAGVMYTLMDVLLDISGYRKYISLLKGLLHGEVRRITEVLFPLIRPIFLYIGNRFSTYYKV